MEEELHEQPVPAISGPGGLATEMRPGKRKALDKIGARQQLIDELEAVKARIRAKVGYPFRVIKQHFVLTKVRFRGLTTNTARLNMLFAI